MHACNEQTGKPLRGVRAYGGHLTKVGNAEKISSQLLLSTLGLNTELFLPRHSVSARLCRRFLLAFAAAPGDGGGTPLLLHLL